MTYYDSDSDNTICNNSGDSESDMFYVTVVTMTCYDSESDNKTCHNKIDSSDSHVLI